MAEATPKFCLPLTVDQQILAVLKSIDDTLKAILRNQGKKHK